MVKRIVLILEDSIFEKLKLKKKGRTWEDLLIKPLLKEQEPKPITKKETKIETKQVTKIDT